MRLPKEGTYGEKDITLTDYLSEPKRYADLWNAGIFQGRQVIFVRFWNRRQNTAKIKTEEIDICKAITDLIADGKTEGISQGITRGIQALIETCKELGVSKRDTLNKVMQKFSCTEEESDKYMTLYWK